MKNYFLNINTEKQLFYIVVTFNNIAVLLHF